ncbi:AsnC family transcriptional regulator [Nocardiopsis terrae]|uniref:DNA-binding Lrp family transcriptional regulator n=1 Tax=Nocardiopsis terrae TaxID=372655 RepID=A0ABR9HIY7_9ACTN|nr:Lrp/AsnC family transcriptional regulator [Nocardiopsis terrae]MBE1458951.1 DNA-binding Lrp family transcriptional regulator [Nocardiopsis terrae]GHC87274.1 AsnC family transcriptional regulator [Nocardiopsis terrae]
MLDAVDAALMRALQGDGRATFQALADGVGLSRTAVRARVRQLVQSGAIRIVGVLHAGVVGMEVLGHVSFRVSGPTGPLLEALGEREAVTFAAQSAGRFPAVAQVRVADDAALTKELADLRSLPGVDGAEVFRANAVYKDAHSSVRELREIELDALDWRLVRRLLKDGRASYADLARQVGLSQAAARSRVVRLLGSGVVHVTALVEPSAVGANEQLGFGLRCRGDADALGAAMANMSRISFLASGFGRYDVIGTLTAPDRHQLVEALEVIRATGGVGHVETWDHLRVRKERRGGERAGNSGSG